MDGQPHSFFILKVGYCYINKEAISLITVPFLYFKKSGSLSILDEIIP